MEEVLCKRKPAMEDEVLAILKKAEKPLRPGEIAKLLGVDSQDVSAALMALKKVGKIESPKRCVYAAV